MEADECNHLWVTNSGQGGAPDYRANRQMWAGTAMHVMCRHCTCRTWFSEAQWWNLPRGTKSEQPIKSQLTSNGR